MNPAANAEGAAELESFLSAMAVQLRLPLAEEHRPGVATFYRLAASMAAIVEAVPLTPHDELAVRFEPVPPAEGGA